MFSRHSILSVLLLCLSCNLFAQAQPAPPSMDATQLWSWHAKGNRAYDDGLYSQAERFFRKAWGIVKPAVGTDDVDQDILVNAAENIIKSVIPQRKIDDAATVHRELMALIGQLKGAPPLSGANANKVDYWQARILMLQGDGVKARAVFQQVLDNTTVLADRVAISVWVAQCLIAQEEWNAAEALLTDALNGLSKEQVEERRVAQRALIEVHLTQGKFEQAAQEAHAGLNGTTGAERQQLVFLRLRALLGAKKFDDAFLLYSQELAESTDYLADTANYPIVRALAQVLADKGNYEHSITILEHLLPNVPGQNRKRELQLQLAETHALAKHYEAAIGHFRRYLELYRNEAREMEIRARVAELYEASSKFEEALNFYQQVYTSEADPNLRYRAGQRIAWIYHDQLKQYDKAIRFLYETSKLDVSDEKKANGLFFSAEIYMRIEDYNNASIHYMSVADSYPKSQHACLARFKQAKARYASERYRMAAEAYQRFIDDCPDDERVPTASFEKGMAIKNAEDFGPAIQIFREFAEKYPEHENAADALLEASEAAAAAGLPSEALTVLSQVIADYADSEQFPYALYKRAYLHLSYGYLEEARADSFLFIDRFSTSHPDLAPDVYLWLGDHFANQQDFAQAEKLFLAVRQTYKDSKQAPLALYEAAKNAYRESRSNNRDFTKSLNYLVQLEGYPDAPVRILAQAKFLRGDISTIGGDFEAAADWFRACRADVQGTELYYAVSGRLAECYATMASEQTDGTAFYQTALDYFNEIIRADVNIGLEEKARYRAGRIYEILKQPDQAMEQYSDIFYDYFTRQEQGVITDWFYSAKAGYRLARLLEDQHNYNQAEAIYKRLAAAGIPISDDAREKEKEMKALYLKGQ